MHEIGKRDIQYGIEMAWHKLTNVVPEIHEELPGLNPPMALRPLFFFDDSGNVVETSSSIAVSLDDGLPVGNAVGDKYAMIGNRQIWAAAREALSDVPHQIVSAGLISDRARGFISVKIAKDFLAGGRETYPTLNLLWGHGGVGGVVAKTGLTVVVCRNTYQMSLSENSDFVFRLRHTGDVEPKLYEMSAAIAGHYEAINRFTEKLDLMADTFISKQDAHQFFTGFMVNKDAQKLSTRRMNQILTLDELFLDGAGNDGNDLSDVFNAVTDYFTHKSSGGEDMRKQYEASEYGVGQDRKREAFICLSGGTASRIGNFDDVMALGDKFLTTGKVA